MGIGDLGLGFDPVDEDAHLTGFPRSHRIPQFPELVGFLAYGIVIEIGLEDALFVRMHDIVPVRADDETVDLKPLVLRVYFQEGGLFVLPVDTLQDE